MTNRSRGLRLAVVWILSAVVGCATVGPSVQTPPLMPTREMRGLWVATVANIDWPSRKGLSADQQKDELIHLLDKAKATGFNTIIFQVRPASDALYASPLEPWAAWLTGSQGRSPGYDPLAFAIEQAHARGLQLHAWINPFRAGNTADSASLDSTHVFNVRRDIVRVYGSNLWMDPGDPESQERSSRVIRDIVARYDVDGIHADDYFYPYQVRDSANVLVPFPDDSTYARYGRGIDRDDWRRANIDGFVERMYREVHAVKPGVVVGISPFGIWRPGNPESVRGLDAYATIYADSRKWLQQGWVDYFVPQLYWPIAAPQQSFPALLEWWRQQNTAARHVWPGLAAYRVQNATASAFSLEEIPEQIRITREQLSRDPGVVLYNTKSTLGRLDATVRERLEREIFSTPSLVPAYPWLGSTAPSLPQVTVSDAALRATTESGSVRWWLLREHVAAHWTWRGRKPATWNTRLVFNDSPVIPIQRATDRLLVNAVDAAGNASAAREWHKP